MNLLKELADQGIGVYQENESSTLHSPNLTIRFQKRELLLQNKGFNLKIIDNYSSEPLKEGHFLNPIRLTDRGFVFLLINNKEFDHKLLLYTKGSFRIFIRQFMGYYDIDNSFLEKYTLKGSKNLKQRIYSNERIKDFLMDYTVNLINRNQTYIITIDPNRLNISQEELSYYIQFVELIGLTINNEN